MTTLSSPSGAGFSLASFNVLASRYARASTYTYCPLGSLLWPRRRERVLRVLLDRAHGGAADVLCLQEVDDAAWIARRLDEDGGYASCFVQRPGGREDGCMVAWRRQCFELVEPETRVELNDLKHSKGISGLERGTVEHDNVGAICVLRDVRCGRVLVVGNVHLYWNPLHPRVKLLQMAFFLKHLHRVRARFPDSAVVMGGDLNSTPSGAVYDLVARGRVPEAVSLEHMATPKLAVDSTLKRAAKWLRAIGVDVEIFPATGFVDASPSDSPPSSPSPYIKHDLSSFDYTRDAWTKPAPEPAPAPAPEPAPEELSEKEELRRLEAELDLDGMSEKQRKRALKKAKKKARKRRAFKAKSERAEAFNSAATWSGAAPTPTPSPATGEPQQQGNKLEHRYVPVFADALAQERVIVTTNRAMTQRRDCPPAILLESGLPPHVAFCRVALQLDLHMQSDRFYRHCPQCFGTFETLPLEEVPNYSFIDESVHDGFNQFGEPLRFMRCSDCGRVRWWCQRRRDHRFELYLRYFFAELPLEDAARDPAARDESIVWLWQDRQTWRKFQPHEMEQLEHQFAQDAHGSFRLAITRPSGDLAVQYVMDLEQMTQTRPETGHVRKIRRCRVCDLEPADRLSVETMKQTLLQRRQARDAARAALFLSSEQLAELGLRSAYHAAHGAEPEFTNFTPAFQDCIDYVLFSAHELRCTHAHPLLARARIEEHVALPSPLWPSDHLLLSAHFEYS